MKPLVSIIVPVYNREDCIERCIESIMAQTLRNIEIIVVDDGSQDNTAQILSDISDERLHVIRQRNTGQGYARNAGLDAANGEYAAFVDSDDTIEPHMLENMYNAAKASDADAVQCNMLDIYPNGGEKVQLNFFDTTVDIYDCGEYTDKYFTPCFHSFEVCNKLIKLDFIRKYGIKFRDTRKYFSEDLIFNLDMIAHLKKMSFINKPYYHYYQNETSHFHKNADARLRGVCEMFSRYLETAAEGMEKAVCYTAAMVIIYTAGLCDKKSEFAKSVIGGKEIKKYINEAVKRSCKPKHKLLMTAISNIPPSLALRLAVKYSNR